MLHRYNEEMLPNDSVLLYAHALNRWSAGLPETIEIGGMAHW